ncbi:MAG: J domain-containing protein [Cyanobacteria bacterium J06607_13]
MKFQYPVRWPAGKQRTSEADRRLGRFSKATQSRHYTCSTQRPITLAQAIARLEGSIEAWTRRGKSWRIDPALVTITANYSSIRQDGMPYSNQRSPSDPAVAVYFELDGESMVLSCDTFTQAEQNIAAIAAASEAYRGLDRLGMSMTNGDILQRLALPERTSADGWWNILGVRADANPDAIRKAYLRLAKIHHPDKEGGSFDKWKRIQAAYQQSQQGVTA